MSGALFLVPWTACVSLALGSLVSPGGTGAVPVPVERSDDDLLIVELRLGPRLLADAVPAYLSSEADLSSGGLLVPLGQVMTALELAVTVDPGRATAEGWFLSENRRFFLDLARRQVLVEGRPADYVDAQVELHADDVYVDTTLLGRWFPVDFEVRHERSQVLVHPREKLPVELAAERQRKWLRSRGGRRGTEGPRHPREALPYRWLDWPAVDHTLTFSSRRGVETVRSSLLAAGDFFRMNGELALSLEEDGDLETRLRLGRRDPEAGLLGPLKATSFELGDLYTPGRPLVSLEGEARGFEISSFPLDRPQEFDRTTLRGGALPGWEVELYHNESLIDFQAVGNESRYEFRDVPLYFGLNLLRLVFHGPQGQRREKVERVLIGQDLVRKGETHYRFAVYGDGRRRTELLPSGDSIGDSEESGSQTEPRYFFELERGLRRALSLSWNVHSLSLEDGRHTYTGLGLLATRKGVLANAHLAADTAGGWAGRLATRAHLPGVDLRFDHEQFFDFVSERTSTSRPLVSRSALEVAGRLRVAKRWTTTLAAAAEEERYVSGPSGSAVSLRLATRLGRLSLAKTLTLRRDPGSESRPRTTEGGWIVTARIRSLRLRGGFGYSVEPRSELRDFQLTAQWELRSRLSTRFHLRHGFADDLANSYQASLAWRFDRFALSLDARYEGRRAGGVPNDRGRFSSGVTLSHSFGREPHSGGWRMRSRSLATQGAAAARVFLDHDLNGRFDPGDEPLEGVRLTSDGGAGGAATNREGIVFVTGLAPYRHVDLGLQLRSLEDPFWIPSREGVGLVTRPGRVAEVELPVTVSAEIDGTVYLREGDGRRAVSGVELQLVDSRGEVRYRATSAFDGFYLFDKVIPGRHTLRVDPGQLSRLGLQAPPEREVVLGGGATVMNGVDLVLELDTGRRER